MKLRMGIGLLAAAGLTLTACGTSSDPDVDAGISPPATGAPGTLKVWLMDGSQPESVTDAVTKQFHKTYPNVEVSIELQQWGGIQDRLTDSLAGESTPDLVEIGNSLTAKYADEGLLADLTDHADDLGVDSMLPGLTASGELDGRRYGVPYYGGVRIMVYRKSDFSEAKVDVPTSLAELETVAKKLQVAHKDNEQYSAFYFPGKYWYGALSFVWAHGGDIATQADGTWTGALDSQESVAGLTQLDDLVQKYSQAPKDGDETKNVDAFNTGNVGMMMDSWWAPGALDTGDLKGDIGAFALPGVESGTTAPVFSDGTDLAISSRSANQGLALEWMKILTGTKIQTQLAKDAGVIPNQEAAFAGHKGNEFLEVADSAALNSKFTPVSPNWVNVESASYIPDMLVRIFTGAATVEEAAQEASTQVGTTLNGE